MEGQGGLVILIPSISFGSTIGRVWPKLKRRRSTRQYKKVVHSVKIFYEESSIVTCETIKVFKITSAKIIGLSLWEAKGSGSKNKKYIHHPTRRQQPSAA